MLCNTLQPAIAHLTKQLCAISVPVQVSVLGFLAHFKERQVIDCLLTLNFSGAASLLNNFFIGVGVSQYNLHFCL